jgi:hypothetical protein
MRCFFDSGTVRAWSRLEVLVLVLMLVLRLHVKRLMGVLLLALPVLLVLLLVRLRLQGELGVLLVFWLRAAVLAIQQRHPYRVRGRHTGRLLRLPAFHQHWQAC